MRYLIFFPLLVACTHKPAIQDSTAQAAMVHPYADAKNLEKEWGELAKDSQGRVSRHTFKDELLETYSAADRFDGKLDGNPEIAAACAGERALCDAADADKDGKLSVSEYLDSLDKAFDAADKNRDGWLEKREFMGMWK